MMRNNMSTLLAILLCTSAAASAFAAASLTPLGILPGGSGSIANGVSDDGSVVVGHSIYNFGDGTEAFRWTSDGGMVGLGDLPGGSFRSEAKGVSADGSVIVGWGTASDSLPREAFRWTSDGGMVSLGYLPGGGTDSVANGVSADGSVIVGTSGGEAFRWTSDDGMVGLGSLLQGYGSEAHGVSDDGSVIVGSSLSDSNLGGYEAFRWTSGGDMVGLGGLPGGTFSFESGATGVSGDGSVVVGWNYLSGLNFPDVYLYDLEFFRWTAGGGMVGLGTLPGGEYGGEATGVSDDGSVIVGYNFTTWDTAAFLWTSDGGLQRLWDVLVANGVDPAADGWTGLGAAYDVSADGSTIVGSGGRNGAIEAFVAVIPVSSPLPGDFNGDNVVDAADYVVWRKNDIDGESGYNTWRANFGALSPGAAAVARSTSAPAVPEPSSLGLLLSLAPVALLGVNCILLLRRRCVWRPNKLKALRCLALAGALTLIAAAPAAAIDTEPLNNSQLTADSLPTLLPGTAISNFARLDGAGGDVDFFQTPLAAGDVLLGMVTPLASLPANFSSPNTMVSVFDDSQARTFNENDAASELPDFDEGRGSLFPF